ncbi:hypothetical protein [Candidatus Ichthyocystis sparus]|uniref:hypothetical protein n=1 Tax=Candidatus Ichthyocystis sparus TaxID=1561004 RepID=UPI000ADA45C9|nr:hypothetical protein [Candidatus Ichthyocystis sparus]
MKRKLSSSEASNTEGNYTQGSVDEQAQSSSLLELEQSAMSVDAGGFVLPPHLAQSLGMRPGDSIFRSMFYGTSQAPLVSGLAAQLLEEHEALISRASGEGTSSAAQSSDRDSALMASNEVTIRALLDSIEAPRLYGIEAPQLQVVPSVVVGGNTTYWQAPGPSASETAQITDTMMHWQAPGTIGTASTSEHWQASGAVENASTTAYWQGSGAVETAGADAYWQASGAVENAGTAAYWQGSEPWAIETAGTTAHWQESEPWPIETAGTTAHWKAQRQSTIVRREWFISAADVALELGIHPGQALSRSMFYSTPQHNVVLGIVNRLSAIREYLLRNQGLERSGVAQEGTIEISYEDTTTLIKTNEALIRALMGSVETPTAIIKEREKKEKMLAKEREKREKMLAKEQEKRNNLLAKEQEKKEKVRKKKEEGETKSREREMEAAIRIARCRKSELERVEDKVEESMKELEATTASGSGRRYVGNDIEIIKANKKAIREVISEPRSEDLQEMEKELAIVEARYEELKQAGADVVGVCQIKIKETRVRKDLEKTMEREIKVKDLRQKLEILVAKELDLEKIGASGEELDKVRKKEIKVEMDPAELRAMIAATGESIELELELSKLIAERTEIEAKIDIGRREIELNKLRKEARAKPSEIELELMLRLEEINTRIRILEMKLEIWLVKYEQNPTELEERTPVELEEERSYRLARSKARLEREEQEQEIMVVLRMAKLRETDLREVKNRVGASTRGPEVAIPSRQKKNDEELKAILEKKKEISAVLGTVTLKNLQGMKQELEKVRARKKELDRVGVGGNAVELEGVRVRQGMIEVELRRARDRVAEVENLERELDTLLAKEVELEVTGASEEEVERVRARQMEIDSRLIESKAMVANARELGIELERLVERERDLERMVDIEERGLELDRLRMEARAGTSEEDIGIALELEGVRVRVRELELELSMELELLMAVELEIKETRMMEEKTEKMEREARDKDIKEAKRILAEKLRRERDEREKARKEKIAEAKREAREERERKKEKEIKKAEEKKAKAEENEKKKAAKERVAMEKLEKGKGGEDKKWK